jgi:hypothetical protein
MTEPIVTPLTAELEPAYEQFLQGCEAGLLYYSLKYRAFLVDLLDATASYWVALRGDRVIGALPVMTRDGPLGAVVNSLPYFGSHGGVLGRDPEAAHGLYRCYAAASEAPGVIAATLIGNPLAPVDESLVRFDLVDERVGQIVSLEPLRGPDPGPYWSDVDGSARRNVQKARASGITVRLDNGALDFVRTCHQANMAAVGRRSKADRFFTLIPRHFVPGTDFNIYIAERFGVPIAALLLFYYNRTVEYFTPVITAAYRSLQPMALLVYSAMVDAAVHGYTRWNFGGTWPDQHSLYRFKRKWRGIDHPYRYYTRVRDRAILVATPEELAAAYDDFYVVPYHALRGAR